MSVSLKCLKYVLCIQKFGTFFIYITVNFLKKPYPFSLCIYVKNT